MSDGVLQFEEEAERCLLQPRRGAWAGRRFWVRVHICLNPLCDCTQMDLECVPLDEGGAEDKSGNPLYFSLDVRERRVVPGPEAVRTAESKPFAECVVADLTETDWLELYGWFLGLKRDVIEKADVTELDAEFPPQIMMGDGTMVGYAEILPFAHGFPFTLGGDSWFVDDQYCVHPDCPCHDVRLTFLGAPKDTPPDVPIDGNRMPSCFYDYKRGEAKKTVHASKAGQPAVKELIRAVKAQYPTFDLDVEQRHLQLRNLYLRAVLKEDAEAMPQKRAEPKNGRNDPCPCGSGKKYKKCCGS